LTALQHTGYEAALMGNNDIQAPVPKTTPKTATLWRMLKQEKTTRRMAPYQTARILSIAVALEAASLLSGFTLEVLPNKKGGRAIKMTPSKLTTGGTSVGER
jgi:hypothetical protein